MLHNKTIAVVVPCYNEETQIGMVIESMPAFVDRIIIVNDCSPDRTSELIRGYIANDATPKTGIPSILGREKPTRYNRATMVVQQLQEEEISKYVPSKVYNTDEEHDRIILIDHLENGGVGAAIARGYKWAKDYGIDCTAVMAGDGQMDPDELESICMPVIEEGIAYVKGNRLIHRSVRGPSVGGSYGKGHSQPLEAGVGLRFQGGRTFQKSLPWQSVYSQERPHQLNQRGSPPLLAVT